MQQFFINLTRSVFTLTIQQMDIKLEKKLIIAVRAALDAGKAIMGIYDNPDSDFNVELKADNSPLTIADKKSNEIITSALLPLGIPVLSEEGKSMPYEERKGWKDLWIVDPLDGTKEFIKRNGEFTVNIAYVKNGSPVLGVIYVPVLKVLYWGVAGFEAGKICGIDAGCDIDDFESLKSKGSLLPDMSHNNFVVVASRSHMSDETVEFIDKLKSLHPEIETVSKGSSLKICLVAEGSADVYPRFAPTMEWDTAAGHAIAKGAGFEMWKTDFSSPLEYNKENLLNPWFIVAKTKLNF